jgi:hypothetical protein
MTNHYWLSGHYINLDEVAAVKQVAFGARVYLRSGHSFRMFGSEQASWFVDALKQRHKTRAQRPDPGTDTTDNGLQRSATT